MTDNLVKCLPITERSPSGKMTSFPILQLVEGRKEFTFEVKATAKRFQDDIIKAFAFWHLHTGLKFTNDLKGKEPGQIRFNSLHNGDSRLPARFEDGVLAYAYFPNEESLGLESDVYMNPRIYWRNTWTPRSFLPLLVLIHEIGHALGIDHQSVERGIMNPYYDHTNTSLAPFVRDKVLKDYEEIIKIMSGLEEDEVDTCPCCDTNIIC